MESIEHFDNIETEQPLVVVEQPLMVSEQQVTISDITLYYYEECYYCQKVLRKIKEYKLDIQLKNIREDRENYLELKKINNGITQVPCLTIKGEPILESDDIIYYLIETFVKD